MKVEVIALKGFGTTKKGARVRLPRDQAQLLVKTKFAAYAPVEPVVPVKKVETRKPQTYARRDMVAERAEGAQIGSISSPELGAVSLQASAYSKPLIIKDDGKA